MESDYVNVIDKLIFAETAITLGEMEKITVA